MARSIAKIAGGRHSLTVMTIILLGSVAVSQKSSTQASPGPASQEVTTVDLSPKNKLVFPYGVQSFERRENLKVGSSVLGIPGWTIEGSPGVVATTIVENPAGITQPGVPPKRWLSVEDFGATFAEGFTTPPLRAPEPWDYSWSFTLQVVSAPATDVDNPVFAIQHAVGGGYQDAWGIRLMSSGAELFSTDAWGTPATMPLFPFSGATDIGEWIQVSVVANLGMNTLRAQVNGVEVGMIRTRPLPTTDLTMLRLSYHGTGAGNLASVLLDDVGVAFLNPQCQEDVTVNFTVDDKDAVLLNGQQIDAGGEFGEEMTISAAGPNNGAAIFDSTPGGPNDPSQDPDLLVDQGNVLILQNDDPANPAKVGDFYPRPNDDEDGGTITFSLNRPSIPQSVDLIDIDDRPAEGATITLTDFSNLTRVFTVPADWTGDISQSEPGVGTLDLTSCSAQPGFNSVATCAEDAGFDPNAVLSIVVEMGGSGALDNLHIIIPCVTITFQTEDDFTPVFSGTPMANGQDVMSPDEFSVELMISDAGPNAGAAIFDSTPGGPNDPGPDNDLLVGLGNILILQNNLSATQTTPGIFDTPNDDTNGGDIFFDFPGPVHVHQLDLIDVDEEEAVGVTVTLEDSIGRTRTFTVPPAWTEDRLNDGPPGFRTLDLDTLAPQPGFMATATAVEVPSFDPDDVIKLTVSFGGAQAMDNICFCPE